jgi:homoserine O-acetyltransferase
MWCGPSTPPAAETDKGHDAIFLDEPALDSALRGFLASAAEKRGLA